MINKGFVISIIYLYIFQVMHSKYLIHGKTIKHKTKKTINFFLILSVVKSSTEATQKLINNQWLLDISTYMTHNIQSVL